MHGNGPLRQVFWVLIFIVVAFLLAGKAQDYFSQQEAQLSEDVRAGHPLS